MRASRLIPKLVQFQHTAARRRLQMVVVASGKRVAVSTHSRAEAAAFTTKPKRTT